MPNHEIALLTGLENYANCKKTAFQMFGDRLHIRQTLAHKVCAVFFSYRVINRWNALDQSAVDAPSVNAFKQTSEGQE